MNCETIQKAHRAKKCRNPGCKAAFVPVRPLQVVCSPSCAYALAKSVKENRERKELKQAKERLKTRSDYIKELDTAFSAYIRYRDKDKPCICCGNPLISGEIGGAFDAGHFISRRHFATRWDERNVHGQRKHCNRYLGGNYAGFREGLIERLGIDVVLELEAKKHENRTFRDDEIKEMIGTFKKKLKELKRCSVV